MSHTPPLRRASTHHLQTPFLTSSPLSGTTFAASSPSTPLPSSMYSARRFASSPEPPSSYNNVLDTAPEKKSPAAKWTNWSDGAWRRLRRAARSPIVWVGTLLLGGLYWSLSGLGREGEEEASKETRKGGLELFGIDEMQSMQGMQFFGAGNGKVHYVGRWTWTPNRLRRDGTFPSVYLDLNVTNTTTILLSLANLPALIPTLSSSTSSTSTVKTPASTTGLSHLSRLSFTAAWRLRISAAPVSLIAPVDNEEYVLLPNCSGLVSVRAGDLDDQTWHSVRIVAPMVDNGGLGMMQFEGVWLEEGGMLNWVDGAEEDDDAAEADDVGQHMDEKVEKEHRIGLSRLMDIHGSSSSLGLPKPPETEGPTIDRSPRKCKKLVEIITDTPGFRLLTTSTPHDLLTGVTGWEYLLGEMFDVDHTSISVAGQCLIQDCIGGVGTPYGMGDVFFRSGPVVSPHFVHTWTFSARTPAVVVLNLGAADAQSFERYAEQYNRTSWELYERFEDTYVSLVKAIRTLAYTNPSAGADRGRNGDEEGKEGEWADVPIFVMRPFRGELEHATQGAVKRLRAGGDRAVFWLDTSGWLDAHPSADYHLLPPSPPSPASDPGPQPSYALTPRASQKIAIYLHAHTCRFLAQAREQCPFLAPEAYEGRPFDGAEEAFGRGLERQREAVVRGMFWGRGEED
ncbi:hypothetical protein B0A49_06739 [Cryomyces minteri]|uniref:Uncharacterized protein n=1 Tax=Cryomyces minteri TaxID=331657 RepID=A0A4U0WWK5_9PEZI|nr:hypothetical protein B0A49_06739 [Cryomyces minteri]